MSENWLVSRMSHQERQVYVCENKSDITAVMGHFGRIVKNVFKRDATTFDFEVVASTLELILTLPPSHGMTSVSKVLRGKAKVCTKNPNFGKCEGMKQYSQAKLFQLATEIEVWLDINGLAGECQKLQWDRSDDIHTRQKADDLVGLLFVQSLRDNAEKFGIATEKPQVKKELNFSKFKPQFLRWVWDNKFDDIRKEIESQLGNGMRAHKSGLATSDASARDCLNLMTQELLLSVFGLTKSRLKDGNFSVNAVVSGILVPTDWVGQGDSSSRSWSELQEAVTGESWYNYNQTKGNKKVGQSVKVKAKVDADGNILEADVITAKGFASDAGGPESLPKIIVSDKAAHCISYGAKWDAPQGSIVLHFKGSPWVYKQI